MAIDDLDYQQFQYVFNTIPGYSQDFSGGIREAAKAVLKPYVGQSIKLLEIGVWEGRSACWLLDNVLTHPNARYVGVDCWVSPPQVPVSARRHLAYHGVKARIIDGDSEVVVPKLTEKFHAVVIDGGHSREKCAADLKNTWQKLLPGGILICDDYAYPGLPEVPAAVDEFQDAHKDDLVLLFKAVAIAFRKLR